MIYLDNAATTKVSPLVLEAMMPYLEENYGNAGSLYKIGRESAAAIYNARRQVASLIGAEAEQIIFTSGGSEANNLVFQGLRNYLIDSGRRSIIVSAVEHDSVIRAAKALHNSLCCNDEKCIKHDFYTHFLGVNEWGEVEIDKLEEMLSVMNVGLVSVMYVNNETGAINNIKEIGRLCNKYGALFHTDCVQAAGCQDINVKEIGCDFLSISAHKIHGAKGAGALFAKRKELISPLIYGGSSQEFGLRGGTENVAGIVGFGKACELAKVNRKDCLKTVSYYKNYFHETLIDELYIRGIDRSIVRINGRDPKSIQGKTLNIMFRGVDAETLMLLLDAKEVCVSAGSACKSHESEPSHVLIGMGLTPDEARDSIRVSFSEFNTESEIKEAAEIIAQCISMLKAGDSLEC